LLHLASTISLSLRDKSYSRRDTYVEVLFTAGLQYRPTSPCTGAESIIGVPACAYVFRTILGWNGDLGYIFRVHGQEINSFRRKTRSKALHEFKLHRQEKFLYVCDTLHMWEWEVRVLDIQEGVEGDHAPVCVGGRGAAPRSSAEVQPATV
jgi:pRiA4b ORF-3-like protein